LGWVQDAYELDKIIAVPSLISVSEFVEYLELQRRVHEKLGVGAGHRWPWACDGFIRAAHSLQLISYNRENDTLARTQAADRVLAEAIVKRVDVYGQEEETVDYRNSQEVRKLILANPQVVRLLQLLDQNPEGLTKYEIGEIFGFPSEPGFTHITQELRLRSGDPNAEGSSDKYARTYMSWLRQLGWAESGSKRIQIDGEDHRVEAYKITYEGRQARRRAEGIPKFVIFESLASRKHPFWERERRVRATIIQLLSRADRPLTLSEISSGLGETLNSQFSNRLVRRELRGLTNFGLSIVSVAGASRLLDRVVIEIPYLPPVPRPEIPVPRPERQIRWQPKHLTRDFLAILEIAFEPLKWRQLEDKVYDVFSSLGFAPEKLGHRTMMEENPDIISYYLDPKPVLQKYAVIIDTKAYQGPYAISTNAKRAMISYINNQAPQIVKRQAPNVYFCFVSGQFAGDIESKLQDIYDETNAMGCCMSVESLLLSLEYRLASPSHVNPRKLRGLFSLMREVITSDLEMLARTALQEEN